MTAEVEDRRRHREPTTTMEQDLHSRGQRRIDLIWETTQGLIAVVVTSASVYAAVAKIDSQVLSNAFFLVIGFYFGRTNHTRSGSRSHIS